MSAATQLQRNVDLNKRLLQAGASKTVYALVTPQTERAKASLFGNEYSATRSAYFDMFREAWTSKQDVMHRDFFLCWLDWSQPIVDLDPKLFPHQYPTAGASEALRHLIFDAAANITPKPCIHFFEGEYEGYKAMAEDAGLQFIAHKREDWRDIGGIRHRSKALWTEGDIFFLSQPSAIDGNVWQDFNEFLRRMPNRSVVVDVTYVGAVPSSAITERFDLNQSSVREVVFSLSKPFGAYYDRIGGVFCRTENPGLFGNMWFKNLTSIALGLHLMHTNDVFALPDQYRSTQERAVAAVAEALGYPLVPSDVYILATAEIDDERRYDMPMLDYLKRAGKLRVCVTPLMAQMIGTGGNS